MYSHKLIVVSCIYLTNANLTYLNDISFKAILFDIQLDTGISSKNKCSFISIDSLNWSLQITTAMLVVKFLTVEIVLMK